MKMDSPECIGKGVYLPPATETMVILYSSRPICTSDPTEGRSSSTEEWEEEDLSML